MPVENSNFKCTLHAWKRVSPQVLQSERMQGTRRGVPCLAWGPYAQGMAGPPSTEKAPDKKVLANGTEWNFQLN